MVLIVGGGWSGLAAAVELTAKGVPVTLVESARTPGGRARSIKHRGGTYDNGQHLMLGAYRELLRLLSVMGIPETQTFERHPLKLQLLRLNDGQTHTALELTTSRLPAPFHIAAAMLGAKGLGSGDRWRALRLCLQVVRAAPATDESVLNFLARHGQSTDLIMSLWGPLCLAIMNTAPEIASARIFRRTLRDAFLFRRGDSDMLIQKGTLNEVFPRPAADWITSQGGKILLGQRVTALLSEEGAVRGVRLADGHEITSSRVILALPPFELARLLNGHCGAEKTTSTLAGIAYEPIATIYLHYPPEVTLGTPMIGLLGTTTQWLLDRSYSGEPGLMAAVISASGPHMKLSRNELADRVAEEIATLLPHWPATIDRVCVREKRATFRCQIGVDTHRPNHESGLKGCLIAGDSSWLPYPATLEGALRSGVECARRLRRYKI